MNLHKTLNQENRNIKWNKLYQQILLIICLMTDCLKFHENLQLRRILLLCLAHFGMASMRTLSHTEEFLKVRATSIFWIYRKKIPKLEIKDKNQTENRDYTSLKLLKMKSWTKTGNQTWNWEDYNSVLKWNQIERRWEAKTLNTY